MTTGCKRRQIFVYALVVFAVAAAFTAWFGVRHRDAIQEQHFAQAEAIAQRSALGAATGIRTWMKEKRKQVVALATTYSVLGLVNHPYDMRYVYQLDDQLGWMAQASRPVLDILVTTVGDRTLNGETLPDGQLLGSLAKRDFLGKVVPETSYKVAIENGAKTFVSEAYTAVTIESPRFYIAAPVLWDGELVATVALECGARDLAIDFLWPLSFGETGGVYLCDSRGEMLAGPNLDRFPQDYGVSHRDVMQRIAKGESGFVADFEGTRRLIHTFPLEKTGKKATTWFICTMQDEAEVQGAITAAQDAFVTQCGIFLGVLGAVLFGGAFWVTRQR
ncbi:cache domain-containing protein [Desulfobaculum sp.]